MAKKADWPLVGARVPPETFAVLEMALLFKGSSMQDVIYPMIVQLAEGFASQPEIRAALGLRDQYQKRTGGRKVVPLGHAGHEPAAT